MMRVYGSRWESGVVCEIGEIPKIQTECGEVIVFKYRQVRWPGRPKSRVEVGDQVRFTRKGKEVGRAGQVAVVGETSPVRGESVVFEDNISSTGSEETLRVDIPVEGVPISTMDSPNTNYPCWDQYNVDTSFGDGCAPRGQWYLATPEGGESDSEGVSHGLTSSYPPSTPPEEGPSITTTKWRHDPYNADCSVVVEEVPIHSVVVGGKVIYYDMVIRV
eukprot:Hpha_TRINITY_DN16226_c2_g2::TRINITY_DN16226_c2_g2_i1::g.15099::m.15099